MLTTIKVLKGISTAVCAAGERHLLKPLETLFYIKALCVDRPFTNCPEALLKLTEISKRCRRTNKRRISTLIEHGFLRPDASGHLHAISWNDLRERYNLLHTKFYIIPISQHVQLEYFIKAKVIAEKKQHCQLGYQANLKRNALRKEMIKEVCGSVKPDSVAEHQLECFIKEGRGYTEDAEYILSMQYRNRKETFLNGDLEINYKTGTKVFGYQSNGGFAALKRSLKAKGVISVQPRRTTLARGTHTTVKSRKTRLGFVLWNEKERIVELIQPDKITVVPYVHVDTVFLLNKQLNQRMSATATA